MLAFINQHYSYRFIKKECFVGSWRLFLEFSIGFIVEFGLVCLHTTYQYMTFNVLTCKIVIPCSFVIFIHVTYKYVHENPSLCMCAINTDMSER